MYRTPIVAMVLAIGVFAGSVRAQEWPSLSFMLRHSEAIPRGVWVEDQTIGRGSGLGLDIQLAFNPFLASYLGWEEHSFSVRSVAGSTRLRRAFDTGMRAGLVGSLPLGLRGMAPYALVGVITNMTAIENPVRSRGGLGGSIEMGYEAGGGVDVPVVDQLSISPTVRYRCHPMGLKSSAALPVENVPDLSVSYFSFDVGVRLQLR